MTLHGYKVYLCTLNLYSTRYGTVAKLIGHIAIDDKKPCTNSFSSCYTSKNIAILPPLYRQIKGLVRLSIRNLVSGYFFCLRYETWTKYRLVHGFQVPRYIVLRRSRGAISRWTRRSKVPTVKHWKSIVISPLNLRIGCRVISRRTKLHWAI